MQLTKDTGMHLPQRWASPYNHDNRVACLYIIPTKILSISMTVAMQGKFYQYKDNKGTNWPLYGNMQVMLSLGEGAFQCLLSIACIIEQWLTDEVTDRILVWKLFLWAFLSMLKKNNRFFFIYFFFFYIWHIFRYSFGHTRDDKGITNQHKSTCICGHLDPLGPLSLESVHVYLPIIKKPPKMLFTMSRNWDDMFLYYVMFE